MSTPLVSVIIPIYNTGDSAINLIHDLLKGNYKNLEIIAIDDGSTDDTLKILKSTFKDNPKVNIYHQKNAGASSARNLGLKKATGKYISFIDSDDHVSPDYLSELVASIEANSAVLAVSAYRYHRVREDSEFDLYTNPPLSPNDNDTYKSYILRLISADGRLYAVINKIFHAEPIKKHNLSFDTTLNFAEDLKFVLAYLSVAKPASSTKQNPLQCIAFVNKPLYYYNYGTPTSTVATSSLLPENWQKSFSDLKKWLGPHPTPKEQKYLKKVKIRWQISQALAVARANLPLRQKLKYLSLPKLLVATILAKFRK
ncbi:glycosyltransferase family 2 protein [Candidatus Saccharibacteria bacterium]|nr:glycosyltransferase family 2 protein [Candidatus Saccharibacteria bacterium]